MGQSYSLQNDRGVDSQNIFPRTEESRGHRFQMDGEKFKGGLNGISTQKVVIIWNKMPEVDTIEQGGQRGRQMSCR